METKWLQLEKRNFKNWLNMFSILFHIAVGDVGLKINGTLSLQTTQASNQAKRILKILHYKRLLLNWVVH